MCFSSMIFMSCIVMTMSVLNMMMPIIMAMAFFTLAERKIMASIQSRQGPNVIQRWGLLQPLADGLKLIIKEMVLPMKSFHMMYIFTSFLTFFVSLLGWAVMPFSNNSVFADIDLGILYVFAMSAMGSYGVIFAGWSSNSSFPMLGSMSSVAQAMSYEMTMGVTMLPVMFITGSLNLTEMVNNQPLNWWNCVGLFPAFIMFWMAIVAETNSAPFDLPEAEAELVAGFNVEYSSVVFALFFLGEYCSMMFMSALTTVLFLAGWHDYSAMFKKMGFLLFFPFGREIFCEEMVFASKVMIFAVLFMVMSACLPSYSYDQFMHVGWKVLLPNALAYLFMISVYLFFTGCFPKG